MSKKIDEIITYLDAYLATTGKLNTNPVEANAILERARILDDSKDRPGKPLRELLRKGFLPHAFQTGGMGTTWIIPHSKANKSDSAHFISKKNEVKKNSKIIKKPQVSVTNIAQIEDLLINNINFKSAGSIDDMVSQNPGLYCIWINDLEKLPKPFNNYLKDRQNNIIYIGIATKNLNKRLNQELRAKGHGTFFRSIGAILGYKPPKGSLINKANKNNYKFSISDEIKIVEWINDNLLVNWVDFYENIKNVETELISKYNPLVNLAKNPFALKELFDLRKICVQIANEK